MKLLSAKEVKGLEPNIDATAAIFSPSTGIVDSFGLMKLFNDQAIDKGADIVYRSEVKGIEKLGDGYGLTISDGAGSFEFDTAVLVNSAGLGSEAVAAMAGIDTLRAGYRLHPCKGEYFAVAPEKRRLLERLVYPLPEKAGIGLGIHSNIDLSGRMRLGPGSAYVSQIDYRVDASHRELFADAVNRFLPFIEAADLEPDTSGIRPALQGPGEGFRDFVIREEADKGLPGFINLIGIESPGLTAAPAIGEMVGEIVDGLL
jgi:L-2-hydroxyglutarate oxidase LhgO